MKKLMIAATAALCATVGLSNSVESANVVGYTTTDTAKGAQQMAGASFVSVGA